MFIPQGCDIDSGKQTGNIERKEIVSMLNAIRDNERISVKLIVVRKFHEYYSVSTEEVGEKTSSKEFKLMYSILSEIDHTTDSLNIETTKAWK